MGIDCTLIINSKETYLDRWYIFSPKITSGNKLLKRDAIHQINKLLKRKCLREETDVWGDRRKEFVRHHKLWLGRAKRIIRKLPPKTGVVFFTDLDYESVRVEY